MTNDFVLAWMREKNVPLTSKEYRRIMYIMGAPLNDIEASVPQEIRDAEDTAWMAEMGVEWRPDVDGRNH